jgi:hypothetical protein
MKTLIKLMLAGGIMAACAFQASATLTMRLSADGGNTWVTVPDESGLDTASGSPGFITYVGPVGAWLVNVSTGSGRPLVGTPVMPVMDLGGFSLSDGAQGLIVQLSDTGFTGFPNETFIARVSGIADGLVTFNSYIDSGNVLFGTTENYPSDAPGLSPSPTASSLLSQGPFTGPYFNSNAVVVPDPGNPYALTLETTLIQLGSGQSSVDALLYNLAPPPCNCTLTFDSPSSITNCSGDAIPDVVASQDCGNGSNSVPVTFVGASTNGVCPQIITRTNSATDDCGTEHTFVQTITVNCKPECTLKASVTNAIAGTGNFNAWVADAGPGATYEWSIDNGSIMGGQGTTNLTWKAGTNVNKVVSICVTVTTAAGCKTSCCVYIPLKPACNCTITFNSPLRLTNCAGDTIPPVTATENCGAGSFNVLVSFAGAVTNGSCPKIITRTNTAVDDCGKTWKFVQTITINCKPDCTIKPSVTCAMSGVSGYTASVANAGAGAKYVWTIVNGTITAGQGTTNITWTAGGDCTKYVTICVTITTPGGCVSSCCVYISVKPSPTGCTFTPGGWGAPPNGNNVATLLYAMFPKLYATKGFCVGGTYTMKFATASNITVYLPAGTTPGVLKKNYTNPVNPVECGEFGSQVMCLKLNIDASNAGYTKAGLANLKVAAGWPLAGYRLSDVLILCQKVLGGTTSALPSGVSVADLTKLLSGVNGNFDNCNENHGVLVF